MINLLLLFYGLLIIIIVFRAYFLKKKSNLSFFTNMNIIFHEICIENMFKTILISISRGVILIILLISFNYFLSTINKTLLGITDFLLLSIYASLCFFAIELMVKLLKKK
jgi:hypothetical protein